MKILGWVLVVVGLAAAWYVWATSTVGAIIAIVVAIVGLWLALRNESSMGM